MSSKERPDADVVRALIESGAVNFDAIGSTLAKYGPQAALSRLDDPWENFCGTMRLFIRVYRLPPILDPITIVGLGELTRLGKLAQGELHQ